MLIDAALLVVQWVKSRRSEFRLVDGQTDIQTFYIPACSIIIPKACYPGDKATPPAPFLRTQTGSLSSVMLEDDYDCNVVKATRPLFSLCRSTIVLSSEQSNLLVVVKYW